MDNLTHTLTGMMIAEGLCAARKSGQSAFRSAAFAASAIANNIPDIDPIYTSITRPRPLGSLLHHRGHTHTLPVAWLLGAIVAVSVITWLERRHAAFTRRERALIFGLGLFGATLHIAMDFGNNYGVHPFWPIDSRWFYGDSIFIIEPFWLVIALPVLASVLYTRWFAWLLWALMGSVFVLAVSLPFVTSGTVIGLALVGGAMIAVSRLTSERARIAVAWGAYLAVAACFVSTATLARARVHEAAASDLPALQIADVALSPMPGNPLCWTALVVGREADQYRVLNANVAPLPSVSDAAACPYDAGSTPTAQVVPTPTGDRASLRWHWSYSADLESLRALAQRDCRFRAWLGFARVPAVSEVILTAGSGQKQQVASELRYDRAPTLDFADMLLDGQTTCPTWLPPWLPPRADLLGTH
ncbi:MAG TPA: metal-dependent hydrolase [Polyangiales bacterium]|nr:metal-dependent hydrolase [Polyangiales bacterium]